VARVTALVGEAVRIRLLLTPPLALRGALLVAGFYCLRGVLVCVLAQAALLVFRLMFPLVLEGFLGSSAAALRAQLLQPEGSLKQRLPQLLQEVLQFLEQLMEFLPPFIEVPPKKC
jgi:hypothetical protein